MSGARIRARARRAPTKYTVQWKETNVQEGVVRVDQHLLSKLIKKEPIEKFYKLDPEPFATGLFACVRRCRNLATGEVLAAKFSSRTRYGEDATKEIHHEIALLSLCSPSPRIVRLHDVFQTPKEFIIVMEFAPGGDMQTIIDDNLVPFESDVVKFVQHVVEGLAYLHHRKIAHLDIKPQNLVMMGQFPDCDIKVCDLEISRVILEGTEIHEVLGTPEYVAPEILHYEPITLAADMWSLGVTTYVLLTGFSPFGGETDQETFLNISRAQVDFPEELFEDISPKAIDFIKRLLVRNPRSRMSAKECLRHPWLASHRKAAEPKRAGCQSCPQSQTLRTYLSKSREALFEKVLSQHRSILQREHDLRKTSLIQRYNKTRRLCESQMSLVSKARQKAEERALTKSREKLYGLKSLSRSHEVLYKSLANLQLEETTPAPTCADLANNNTHTQHTLQHREEEVVEVAVEGEVEVMAGSGGSESVASTSSESEVWEEEGHRLSGLEEDEPRYTVAQLVSAYDLHQRLVTQTSLEVTMRTPPVTTPTHRFPTGPNALRLFIPDINISTRPKRRRGTEDETQGTPLISDLAAKEAEEGEVVRRLQESGGGPKYLRSGCKETSTIARTAEIFNGGQAWAPRPHRKSFSTPSPLQEESGPVRRKSSPPTMKPSF